MPYTKKSLAAPIKHAVIDVGSNSVRLVIYNVIGKAFIPIHNEKTLAALGRGLGQTGCLSPEGVQMALIALRRFKLLLDALEIRNLDAIATAAVRDASDGRTFVELVQREIGLKIRVISGEDEGRLSALGVEFGAPNAQGFMGDLGGSSLELVSLGTNGISQRESWQLGPLALGDLALPKNIIENKDITRRHIQSILKDSSVFANENSSHFHAVGGAWRSIAHIHMVYRNYPLHVLHNYKITRSDALQICDFVSSQSKKSLERIAGVSSRRADTLPYAALLMHEIVSLSNSVAVIISSFGLREGILAEKYSIFNLKSDPLVESAFAHAGLDYDGLCFTNALHEWLKPVLQIEEGKIGEEFNRKLVYALCILANTGLNYHPDHRAYLSYELLLRAPFSAVFHSERVFLARAIAARYGAKQSFLETLQGAELISIEEKLFAEKIGLAIRLAANMCSNSAILLEKSSISIANGELILTLDETIEPIYSHQVQRRHQQLALALGIKASTNMVRQNI